MLTYELKEAQGNTALYRYFPEKAGKPGHIALEIHTGVISLVERTADDAQGRYARCLMNHLKQALAQGGLPEKGCCDWGTALAGEIRLIRPSMQYAQEISSFRKEVLAAGDEDGFAGCSWLEDYESVQEWLDFLEMLEHHPEQSGHVPSSTFLAVRQADQRLVGIIDLRHHIDHPVLSTWGGHIGYTVRPGERRKGYATQMLRLDLRECEKRGIGRVLITCRPQNVASERAIQANGGVFEKEIQVDGEPIRRYWITPASAD